jgi:hypothetical protein
MAVNNLDHAKKVHSLYRTHFPYLPWSTPMFDPKHESKLREATVPEMSSRVATAIS